MPSLSEDLLHTTVRIEGETPNGVSVGTGFFFKHKDKLFLITNKHVVKNITSVRFVLLKAAKKNDGRKPIFGEGQEILLNGNPFIGHPDPNIDVTAMNISSIINTIEEKQEFVYWKNISEKDFPTENEINDFITPLEDIVFIGYPNGIWDSKNILPIARKGMTATPYYIDYEGEKKFLVDASVFPGSSGSPVFIYYAGGYPDKKGRLYAGNKMRFIGIVAQVYHCKQEGEIKVKNIPTNQKAVSETKQMIDLGIVFKAICVKECVEHHMLTAEDSPPNEF